MFSRNLLKTKISDIYTDQRFRIIEIKKSAEAHNPIILFLTKTKESVSSTSVFLEGKYSKKVMKQLQSTPLKTNYSTKGSDRSVISSISSDLSNDRTSYLTVAEP